MRCTVTCIIPLENCDRRERRKADVRCAVHELAQSGQTGLVHMRLLLTQHEFAVAAHILLRCRAHHRSGRSRASIWTGPKPYFRRSVLRRPRRGISGRFGCADEGRLYSGVRVFAGRAYKVHTTTQLRPTLKGGFIRSSRNEMSFPVCPSQSANAGGNGTGSNVFHACGEIAFLPRNAVGPLLPYVFAVHRIFLQGRSSI